MAKKAVLSDIVGLVVTALASGAVLATLSWMRVVPEPWVVWLIAFPFLMGASLWAWHISESTREWGSKNWGAAVLFTPLIGAISFAIDVMIGGSNGQYETFIEAAAHAGSPFGFLLTVLICPIGTVIALGSWIRCLSVRVIETRPRNPEV